MKSFFVNSVFIKVALITFIPMAMARAAGSPPCLGTNGAPLPVNDQQVINWKNSTPNQYHNRGHIEGVLTQVFSNNHGHHHFEVKIGPNPGNTIEVIYNEAFGSLPQLQPGDQIEACGDYITSNAQAGRYPPSPDGAILHWVHEAPRPTHESGYVVVDGQVCGQHRPRW